jgi:hypothetical protein
MFVLVRVKYRVLAVRYTTKCKRFSLIFDAFTKKNPHLSAGVLDSNV